MRLILLFAATVSAASWSCTGSIGRGSDQSNSAHGTSDQDPAPALIRRVTRREYVNAIRDLVNVDASAEAQLIPDELLHDGFDNNSVTQSMSVLHGTAYLSAAIAVAERAVQSAAQRGALVGCDVAAADGAACFRRFTERFVRRAYRRPLEPEEALRFQQLADFEPDRLEAVKLVIATALQSPNFLYRVEVGLPNVERPHLSKLDGYELATRLSFLLFGSIPNEELLDAAENGMLATPAGLAAVVRAQLSSRTVDGRIHRTFQEFTAQWFHLRQLDQATRLPTSYPAFGPELVAEMKGELLRVTDDYLWNTETSLLDMYVAPHTYLTARLADIYNVPPPSSLFQRFDWTAGSERGGLLTLSGLLAASTPNNSTSVIHRGRYVRDVVLCDPLPPPPPGVPQLEGAAGETQQAAEMRHSADPVCSGCHRKMDPIGIGLEQFDAVGAFRTTYADGSPVATRGRVDGLETPDFEGGKGLGVRVRDSKMASLCAVKKLFQWTMGRSVSHPSDARAVEQLEIQFGNGGQIFTELIVSMVTSDAFRFRLPAEENP